jgi:hypothetical protein
VREFGIIKATARAAGRPLPHAMLYMNSVYDWPFDKTHGKGATNIDVLDIHGVPHAEQCDPGIYPSFFLDHGREAGQAAFLDIFRTYIKGGDTADGVVGAPAPCRTVLRGQRFTPPCCRPLRWVAGSLGRCHSTSTASIKCRSSVTTRQHLQTVLQSATGTAIRLRLSHRRL